VPVKRYRFYLSSVDSQGTLVSQRECVPTGGKGVRLKIEKESGQIFYRAKLSGNLKFSRTDFEFLFDLETSTSRCYPVYFTIEKRISGDTYSPYFAGKFSLTECKWDVSKCLVEAPVTTVDRYTRILEEYEREHNVLQVANVYTVEAKFDFSATFEFTHSNYTRTGETVNEA